MRIRLPNNCRPRTASGSRKRVAQRIILATAAWLCCVGAAPAQEPARLQQILERLDRLEEQNRALLDEVRALRSELEATRPRDAAQAPDAAAQAPTVEERVAVNESRIAELAQTKVEAARRFPIRLTGMALFNSFWDSRGGVDGGYPAVAAPDAARSAGATLRQTILGLEYRGPATLWGGKVRGSVLMDFFGGSGRSLEQLVRLRTASIGIDWKARSLEVGILKPLIAPRDPDSLAQVGIPPLAGAGNLWQWIPQARFEQRFHLGPGTEVRAQLAAVQTDEVAAYGGYPAPPGAPAIEPKRPGIEGRVEFSRGEERRIEIAPGFHRSVSHVAGTSVPSNVFSLDWYASPGGPAQFTGAFFTGENAANLGTAGQGFAIRPYGHAAPVHSTGGWAQLTLKATSRLSFHVFSGAENDRDSNLAPGGIGKNLAYGANFFYRLAPNVLVSVESMQVRTNYAAAGRLLGNHYDLALAYMF
jgi:hypothetical protein